MSFPSVVVALLAELPAGAFDGAAVSGGAALGCADEDEPTAGGVATEAADGPPKLLT